MPSQTMYEGIIYNVLVLEGACIHTLRRVAKYIILPVAKSVARNQYFHGTGRTVGYKTHEVS